VLGGIKRDGIPMARANYLEDTARSARLSSRSSGDCSSNAHSRKQITPIIASPLIPRFRPARAFALGRGQITEITKISKASRRHDAG
jgi:hypothetical protein